jgi:hypothetical protein
MTGTVLVDGYLGGRYVATYSVTDEGIDMIVRPATFDELGFVAATWIRRVWNRNRPDVQTCAANGQRTDESATLLPVEERTHIALGNPTSASSITIHAEAVRRMEQLFIDETLADASTHVVVATLPDLAEPMGWACWGGSRWGASMLHYVYVRDTCRHQRVATRLVQHTGCSAASHVTPSGRALLRHLRRGG